MKKNNLIWIIICTSGALLLGKLAGKYLPTAPIMDPLAGAGPKCLLFL